jgi:hypothetical protein
LWRPPPSFGPAPISEGQADFAISQAFLDVVVERLRALNKSGKLDAFVCVCAYF